MYQRRGQVEDVVLWQSHAGAAARAGGDEDVLRAGVAGKDAFAVGQALFAFEFNGWWTSNKAFSAIQRSLSVSRSRIDRSKCRISSCAWGVRTTLNSFTV